MKQRLSDALDDFEAERLAQGLKQKTTIRGDMATLVPLLTHIGNIYVENITENHLTAFLAQRTKTRGASSIGQDVKKLRAFFAFAHRTRRCGRDNPAAALKLPKVHVKERERVPVQLFPHLLDTAGRFHARDRIFFALCIYTLCRTGEIETMRLGDVDLDNGRILAHIHKSNLDDSFPISAPLDAELRNWLKVYASECGSLDPDWFLVPARRSRLVGYHTSAVVTVPTSPIRQTAPIVKRTLIAAGWTIHGNPSLKGEGAHTLRRSGATAMYDWVADAGYDDALDAVQTVLHHSNRKTTEGYIGRNRRKKTRDELLLGKDMYGLSQPNVVPLNNRAVG